MPDEPLAAQAGSAEVDDEVFLVWDGDQYGGNAKEWASCNLKEACKSTAKAVPSGGTDESVGLEGPA